MLFLSYGIFQDFNHYTEAFIISEYISETVLVLKLV